MDTAGGHWFARRRRPLTGRSAPLDLDRPIVADLLARCRFTTGAGPVECGVSGGADSSALAVLAVAAGLDVTLVHVDHGVRPGSAAEADVVATLAARLGAEFEARRVDVAPGPNLEARLRDARHGALAPGALLGHTLDDQAETVLWFLMRGTGPEGLAGIDPARRPLLGLRRAETVRLCDELGVGVIGDPSNEDAAFTRNRIRAELLPLMDDIAGRDVAPLVARAAALQRDLLTMAEAAAANLDPTDAASLAAAEPAVAAAAIRAWWRRETGERYAPDAAAVARVIDVAAGGAVAADVTRSWEVRRSKGRLRLTPLRPGDDSGGS